MKISHLLTILLLSVTMSPLHAEANEAELKAPNGGRLIEVGGYQVEFYVTPERLAELRFFDKTMQPIILDSAIVQVVAQAEGGAQKLDLVLHDGVYRSETPMPHGNPYNVILRIKTTVEASFENLRFVYNTTICTGCRLAEYACTCEGHNH